MNDNPKHELPDLDEIKSALPEILSAFSTWFQTAEHIESGTAAYVDILESTGCGYEKAPPSYIQFKGGSWVEEWPGGNGGWMDFPHYSTLANQSSFVSHTLIEAAWWLWVNWAWQEGGDIPRKTHEAAFARMTGPADADA